VNWGTQALVTTYSGTNLMAKVPSNLIAAAAVANLTVNCGSETSSVFPFSVLQPGVPAITGLSPSTISIGGKSALVKVLGRNLSNWSTASQGCPNINITKTTPVSSEEIDLSLDISSASSAEACDVFVNTLLAGASNPGQLTFVNQPSYTLNVTMNPPGGGAVSGPPQLTCSNSGCTGTFPQGTTVSLAETTADHAAFGGWGGDCAIAGTSPSAAIAVNNNMNCSANFSLTPGTVMVSVASDLAGAGHGSVTASTAETDSTSLNCSSQLTGYAFCSGIFTPDGNVTFTAAPSGAATFDYWSGCPSASSGPGCTLPVMPQGTTIIEAFFKSQPLCDDPCNPACPNYDPAGSNCPSVALLAVRSSASYAPGRIAPGQIVSVFGTNVGPSTVTSLQQDPSGDITTTLGGTTVYFDGIPAPVLATSRQQVNVIVPYQTFGQPTTTIQVEHDGNLSAPFSIPLAEAAPALFTIDASGKGQGAVVNQDGTINSASQPAPRGSIVSFYGTGAGITGLQLRTGQLVGATLPSPLLSVEAFVAGIPAQVQYAGGSPGEVTGLLQVNVQIPPEISPGTAVPIQLRVGGVFTQPGVTIAIQ
jgi:uncharacterized protein (TIGR03437 family)